MLFLTASGVETLGYQCTRDSHQYVPFPCCPNCHYNDVIMSGKASQITSLTIVYSIVYSDPDKKKKTSRLPVTGLCAGNSPLTLLPRVIDSAIHLIHIASYVILGDYRLANNRVLLELTRSLWINNVFSTSVCWNMREETYGYYSHIYHAEQYSWGLNE